MNEELYNMIFKRKSFHLFRNTGALSLATEELRDIEKAYTTFTPLYPDIRTAIEIVPAEKTSCKRGQEYCILLYSEQKGNYLQNIGYLGEQLDLYLVSKNIGTLWFGIGKPEELTYNDLSFVIMIGIKKIENETSFRKDMFKSKRKPVEEIWQGEQIKGVTDIVRFTPSACNTQPWLVKNEDCLSVYRYKKLGKRGIMPADKVSYYNRIDIGIFLCFLELCFKHNHIAFKRELFADDGEETELCLNAMYQIDE
ncbi:MAG: nitroreductase [Solobacterium sp.]|nr:nitroreductase [Solobacterium sp.]